MAQYACPQCPEDCSNADLPNVDFSDCTDSVVDEESEITDIFLSTGAKPEDWTSTASWNAILGQSGSNNIRRLTGIGDEPIPEPLSRAISGGRTISENYKHTINFWVDDLSDANYSFMQRLQCGGSFRMWYQTIGGFLYGGPNGIQVNVSSAAEVLERGENSFATLQYVFKWTAGCNPDRIETPIDQDFVMTSIFEDQFEEQFE
jgi:hypothetical protein